MGSRLKLQEIFEDILGTRNVYYNPPSSVQMKYPCIKYSLEAPDQKRANNNIYISTDKYKVTVIDYDPESEIPGKIQQRFSMASIGQRYKADNLNHTVIDLYH